jgi:predicted Zn-dependent protease
MSKPKLPPQKIIQELEEIGSLIESEKDDQLQTAEERLVLLARKYPDTEVLYEMLNSIYLQTENAQGLLWSSKESLRLSPNNPIPKFLHANALLLNMKITEGIGHLRQIQKRWPKFEAIEDINKILDEFYKATIEAKNINGTIDELIDLMREEDRIQQAFANHQYEKAEKIGDRILQRYPNYEYGHINLTLKELLTNRFSQALHYTNRLLKTDPANVSALSMLAEINFLTGRLDELETTLQKMRDLPAETPDKWSQLAFVLAFTGKLEELIALEAEIADLPANIQADIPADFYHFLAFAYARNGKNPPAKKYWKKALQIEPEFEIAQENLDELSKAKKDRHPAFAFEIFEFMDETFSDDFDGLIDEETEEFDPALCIKLLENYPRLYLIAPILMKYGTLRSVLTILELAFMTRDPQLMDVVETCWTNDIGGKLVRSYWEAMQIGFFEKDEDFADAAADNLMLSSNLPDGTTAFEMEIYTEPDIEDHHPKALEHANTGYQLINKGKFAQAQQEFEKALKIEPGAPYLINNLALSLAKQGMVQRAREIIEQLHVDRPEYLFAGINVAHTCIAEKNYPKAREILSLYIGRKRYHISEMTQLAIAEAHYWKAVNNPEQMNIWLDILEKMDPDHPELLDRKFSKTINKLTNWKK